MCVYTSHNYDAPFRNRVIIGRGGSFDMDPYDDDIQSISYMYI